MIKIFLDSLEISTVSSHSQQCTINSKSKKTCSSLTDIMNQFIRFNTFFGCIFFYYYTEEDQTIVINIHKGYLWRSFSSLVVVAISFSDTF